MIRAWKITKRKPKGYPKPNDPTLLKSTRRLLVVAWSLVVLLGAGCGPEPKADLPPPSITNARLVTLLEERTNRLNTLRAEVKLKYLNADGKEETGDATLFFLKPANLRLIVKHPLGGRVLEMVADEERWYLTLCPPGEEKRVYTALVGKNINVSNEWNLLRPEHLLWAFGRIRRDRNNLMIAARYPDKLEIGFIEKSDNSHQLRYKLFLRGEHLLPRSIETFDRAGDLSLVVKYMDWKPWGREKVMFPGRVTFSSVTDKSSLSITFRKVEFPENMPKKRFQVRPDDLKLTPIDLGDSQWPTSNN